MDRGAEEYRRYLDGELPGLPAVFVFAGKE